MSPFRENMSMSKEEVGRQKHLAVFLPYNHKIVFMVDNENLNL